MTLGRSTDGWGEGRQSFFSPWTYCPQKMPFVLFIFKATLTGWLLRLWWKSLRQPVWNAGWSISGEIIFETNRGHWTEKDKYYMISYVESKKQNKKPWQNRFRYREQTSDCQRGSGWGQEQNRMKRYTLSFVKQISHRDVTYSVGNIVNNTAITLYDDRWLLNLAWWSMHHTI